MADCARYVVPTASAALSALGGTGYIPDTSTSKLPTMRPSFFLVLMLLFPCVAASMDEVSPAAGSPAPLPLSTFLDPGEFASLKISPDGTYFAATVPMGDRTALVVVRRGANKQTAVVNPEKKGHVVGFEWVNDRQVVYWVATKEGSLAAPVGNPFLYIVDADVGNPRPVDKRVHLWLWDELRNEDDVILVGGERGRGRLDLRTGKFTRDKASSPLHSETHYLDNAGKLRLARGFIAQELYPRLYLLDAQGKWKPVNVESKSGETLYVSGFSADNRSAYMMVEQAAGTDGFYRLDLETLERTPVLRNERVDATHVLNSPITGAVIAVVYLDGKPRIEYVDPEDPHAKALMRLSLAFPDSYVFPTSYTRDGKQAIYSVSSDVNSGEYYLVDHQTSKAQYIAANSEKLDPRLMSPMTPFRFKARDGLELEGFLTRPASWPAGKAGPMVVMPHGGPKGIYDRWGFDSEVQMLASRGYAVLQLNFRGSGNYGKRFRDLGNREWGRKMQDDLTDATHWAIEQRHASKGRICMYGASYGAYAAMMGLVREPALYACGIGNVGVYDIPQLYRDETVGTRYGQEYMNEMLGKSDLGSISPPALADKITVPVLLGAGEEDYTAPADHTRTLRRALLKAGVSVESVIYPKEGHGYYDPANRRDWAERVLAMLERTIGRPAPAAPSP